VSGTLDEHGAQRRQRGGRPQKGKQEILGALAQVLEDQQHRLPASLAEDEAREGLQRVLASLARLELRPPRALDRHAEERLEGRRGGPGLSPSSASRPVTFARVSAWLR
jgi:hypothetical protein